MKVLLTGANGFVGSAFLRYVKEYEPGLEITLLSSISRSGIPTIVYEKKNNQYCFAVNDTFDVVLHLGSWTPKEKSESNNIVNSCSNITFTERLLNAISGKARKFIYVSSLDVYSGEGQDPVNEQTMVKPVSLYGYSKLFCEQMVTSWGERNNVSTCILRLGHIYGEGEAAYKKMIPVFIKNALSGKPITIFSDGKELRSFLYINDCVEYIAQAVTNPDLTGIYNIASGNAYSVRCIADMVSSIIGNNTSVEILGKSIPVRNVVFDIKKIQQDFHVVETDIIDGLKREVNYFESNG